MNKTLLRELMQLSPAERVEIAQELWNSVDEADLPPLTPAQAEEIDRRVAEHERDQSTVIPLEKFKEMMQARFR